MRSLRARPARSLLWRGATVIVAVLLAALVLTLWLRAHPERILTALNAWLPGSVRVLEVRGPGASATGGRIERLRLELNGATLTIDDARWYWGLDSLRPLRFAPRSLTIARFEARLPPENDQARITEPLLPRFWTTAWWPALGQSDLTVERLLLRHHDSTELLSGRLTLTDGGNAGSARLRIPQRGAAQLQWQPASDTPHAWHVDWSTDVQAPVHGVAELLADPLTGAIAWKLHAYLQTPGAIAGVRELQLDANGNADPFDAASALLVARMQADVTLDTPSAATRVRCTGGLSAAQSFATAITLDTCDGHFGDAGIVLRLPLLLALDADGSPQSLSSSGGTLQLDRLPIDLWEVQKLRLGAPATTLWQSGSTGLATPAIGLALRLAHASNDIHIGIDGHLDAAHVDPASPRVNLRATLRASHGALQLQPLELHTALAMAAGVFSTDGALQHATVGHLLDWHIAYTNASTALEGKLSLDSRDWRWGDGLLRALLGTRQPPFAADLRSGRLRMTARLDGRVARPRVRIEATADDLGGTIGRAAFVGLGCAPLSLTWESSRLRLHDDIDCSARSVNAGVTLDTLHLTLQQTAEGWRLRDAGAQLMGGSIAIAAADITGSGPIVATANIRGIDLARVEALLDDPALTLTGRLDGELPFTLQDGVPILRAGKVHSSGPGVIRYRPPTPPAQESTELALTRKALSNLEFDSVDATLDYGADGALTVGAAIRGRNPDLDAQRPVHLNLTLETNLRTLMQSLSAGERVNAWLEQHL